LQETRSPYELTAGTTIPAALVRIEGHHHALFDGRSL
jgi:hypothetical protein